MKHIHEDDMELYLLGRLPEQDSSRLESHVRGCAQCEARLNDAVHFVRQLVQAQRSGEASGGRSRIETRIPTNDPANVRLYDPLLSEQVEVRVLNASKGGLLVQTSKSFEVGAFIQLRLRRTIVIGEVRHCSKVEDGFHVGVQIQDAHASERSAESR